VDRGRTLRTVVTVAAIVLAVLPAAVVFGFGWLTFGHPSVPAGGTVPRDATPPEAWALFALFYVAWMFGLMVLLIWTFDRLGHHWRSWDRAPRKEKKRRLRLTAGLGFLAGQEKARTQAATDAARRRATADAARKRAASEAARDTARARAAGSASGARPRGGPGGASPGSGRGGGA
jgi:hypothetical protein